MRSHLTADHIANEIRMTRSQFAGSFLIVEGQGTDARVYGGFIDDSVCQIIPAHGKENAIRAIEILEQSNFSGVLAIVDADFWRLDSIPLPSPNVFITDAHDLEMMILQSPALEKVLREVGSDEKIKRFTDQQGKPLREILLNIACPIGCLRWISLQENLSLIFEDIDLGKFVDERTLTINIIGMITTIKNKSRHHALDEAAFQEKVNDLINRGHDLWDICCGHDLTCVLSLGLRKAFGSNNAQDVRPEMIEKFLRVAYAFSYFSATQLAQSLRDWEVKHAPFQIFSMP